jgi:hypothetical protein
MAIPVLHERQCLMSIETICLLMIFYLILIVQKFLETGTLIDDYSSGTFCKTVGICGAFLIVRLVQAVLNPLPLIKLDV